MAVELQYKHQQKTYKLMKQELAKKKKVAYVFPVGCGKSFPGLKHIEDNPGKNVLVVVPSMGIKNQFKRYIKRYVNNGNERLKNKEIQIVTYQKVSLTKNIEKDLKPDIIILDEIHRMGAETWEPAVDSLMESFAEADVIGMSATPERTDKRNMAYEKFDEIVYEMSLTEALSGEKEDEVVLKTPRYVRVISQLIEEIASYKEQILLIDNEEKRKAMLAKYERLEEKISEFPDIQDVMEQGMTKKNGKYIIFCKDREDMFEKMKNAGEIFGKVNTKINTEYVISKTETDEKGGKTPAENRRTIERFVQKKNGEELNLLFCVDMLNEGVHLEGIDGEVMFRTTESNILYKQQIGRVLSADKEAGETVIIDAVNNWLRQIETYREIERAIQRAGRGNTTYDLLNLTAEEIDLLSIMREIREELRYNNNAYEEIIEWLENHEGKMPRIRIKKETKNLKREEMTKEEQYEVDLRSSWNRSEERKILEKYKGIEIEEIPEEYREKIAILRGYGLGIKEKTIYEEIIEWLENHKGKMPRGSIVRQGKYLTKKEEKTEEEHEEVILYSRWKNSEERKILEEYKGRTIEEVPEEYREKIAILREYGLGLKEKTTYEEIIEWLENHKGKMPRGSMTKQGKRLKREEMTEEEKEEANLYDRWITSEERKILEEYKGRKMEEVPQEYREKIAKLRALMQKRKDNQILSAMKSAVGHQIENNGEIRQELNYQIQKEENNKHKSVND